MGLAVEHDRLTAALSQWIGVRTWETWGTLTTAVELTGHTLRRQVTRFLDRLRQEPNAEHLSYFWATEHGTAGGRLHVHLLLGGAVGLLYNVLHDRWGEGTQRWRRTAAGEVVADPEGRPARSHWQSYRDGGGAVAYCAKYVTKGLADWDFFWPEQLQPGDVAVDVAVDVAAGRESRRTRARRPPARAS